MAGCDNRIARQWTFNRLRSSLSAKIRKKSYRTYVVVGDGELGEGMIWEAAMAASHHKAASITLFVDNNNYQSGGSVEEVSGPYPIDEKWRAFGWNVLSVEGHEIDAILSAVKTAHQVTDKPTAIICKTVKVKSFLHGRRGTLGQTVLHR